MFVDVRVHVWVGVSVCLHVHSLCIFMYIGWCASLYVGMDVQINLYMYVCIVHIYTCLKNCTNCLCRNFVKCQSVLIIFGK